MTAGILQKAKINSGRCMFSVVDETQGSNISQVSSRRDDSIAGRLGVIIVVVVVSYLSRHL